MAAFLDRSGWISTLDHCFVQLVVAAYIVLLLVRFSDSSIRHIKWILQLGFSNNSASSSSSSRSSSSRSNFGSGGGDVQTRPWMKQSSRNRAQQRQQHSKRKARKLSYTKQRRPEEEQNRCHSDAADDLGTFTLRNTTTVDPVSKYQWSKTAAADDLDVHLSKCVDSRRKKQQSKADDENALVSSCIHSKHRAIYTIELDDSGRPSKDFFIKQSTTSKSNLNLYAHDVWGICTEPPAISWARLSKRKGAIRSCNIEFAKSDHDNTRI